jgi:hypothetical protein
MSAINLNSTQLRQAAAIKEKIAALEKKLAKIVGPQEAAAVVSGSLPKKSKFSPAAIARIRAAQKARWAKLKETLAKHAA